MYDSEYDRIRRMEGRMNSIDPEKKSRVNIYQSATSNDAGQAASVTYNHYEIHIHLPNNMKPEQLAEAMKMIKEPEKIEPSENITVKKNKWRW